MRLFCQLEMKVSCSGTHEIDNLLEVFVGSVKFHADNARTEMNN